MEVAPKIASVGYPSRASVPPGVLSGSLAHGITVSIQVFPSWSVLGSIIQSSANDGIVSFAPLTSPDNLSFLKPPM